MNPLRLDRLTPLALAFLLAASGSAFAQGTSAQREACAPDAIRLCQDTIPDVAKTAACMRAHEAELSPSCRREFVAAGAAQPADATRSRRRAARVAPERPASPADDGIGVGLPEVGQLDTDASDTPASRAADRRNARRVVSRLCRSDILDADTCRFTQSAIDLSR